jgi:ribonuclease HI
MTNLYELFFDGAFKDGDASFGFVLYRNGTQIDYGYGLTSDERHEVEMRGLAEGLDCFIRRLDCADAELSVFGDSIIAVNSAHRDPIIKSKLDQISKMVSSLEIAWIPREQNKIADDLAKKLRSFA